MDLIWSQCFLIQTKDLYQNTTYNLTDLKRILKGTKVTVYNHNRIVFFFNQTCWWPEILFCVFSLTSLRAVRNSPKPIYLLHLRLQLYFGWLTKDLYQTLTKSSECSNKTAVLTHTRLRNHLNPLAHWLPELIAGSSIFKCLHGVAPNYRSNMIMKHLRPMCKKQQVGWMNMQIQSLTRGSTFWKAGIQQLPWLL